MTPEIIARGCADLIVALEEYEEMIRRDGGVDVATAIDGTPRQTLPHRDPTMSFHWWDSYQAMLCLADGSMGLLEQVGLVLAPLDLESPGPSMEAMLCVAEDLTILANLYQGRLGA